MENVEYSEPQENDSNNICYKHFLPLVLAMSTNQPKLFWNQKYDEERDSFIQRINLSFEEQLNSLFVWFGLDTLIICLKVIEQIGIEKNSKILDLGTGNGHLAIQLTKCGYVNVVASDFSESAIGLSKIITKQMYDQELKNNQSNYSDINDSLNNLLSIEYVVDDILDTKFDPECFDVIIDKGTLDSIILAHNIFSNEEKLDKNQKYLLYLKQVSKILKSNQIYIIISCNHKEEELIPLFLEFNFSLIKNLSDIFSGLIMLIFKKG